MGGSDGRRSPKIDRLLRRLEARAATLSAAACGACGVTAPLHTPLHAPNQGMQRKSDGAMARRTAAIRPCGTAMGRASDVSTGPGPGAATNHARSVAPAAVDGAGVGSDLMHARTSHHAIRNSHKIGSWTDETLHAAMDKITDQGMKLKVAAKIFGIPSSSLRDHLYGKTTCR